MITEDYVSFETAKLLKEKGFDEECKKYYNLKLLSNLYYGCGTVRNRDLKDEDDCIAPTLQMAMKWLREMHHLHITVFSSSQESWMYRITKPHEALTDGAYGEDFDSYEEACEEAIKYCLENLV